MNASYITFFGATQGAPNKNHNVTGLVLGRLGIGGLGGLGSGGLGLGEIVNTDAAHSLNERC